MLSAVLFDDNEIEEAIQKFKAAMKSPEVAVRAGAIADLGRLRHEKIMKVLGACLTTDDKAVRSAAARALGQFQEKKPQISAILTEALTVNAREPEVVMSILTALKDLREVASLATAYRYIDDKNGKVAEAAIAVTEVVRSRNSIDPLLRLLKKLQTSGDGVTSGDGNFDVPPDEQLRERARKLQTALTKALQSITGENLSSVEDWELWWKRNAATFKVKS